MTEVQEKIADRADQIQSEMQNIINNAKQKYPKSKAGYNDYVNAYLISRIAALEIALENKLVILGK